MPEYNLGRVKGTDGNGIKDITKTETVGLNDIYTITMDDDTEYTFVVTNGEDGSAGDIDDNVTQNSSNPVKSSGIYNALTAKASNTHTHGNISNDGKIGSTNGKIVVTGSGGALQASDIKTINNNSLIGSGNIDIQGGGVDIVTAWESTLSDTKVPSEKLTKNTIDGLDIPTKISDLTNDSDFIETSSTTGLIKNDGTVMTSGTGSTNYSAGNHTHSGYVSATKVTSWSSTTSDSNVPSEKLVKDTIDALEDLIGDAIDYINL
jgi:hypothetical protein